MLFSLQSFASLIPVKQDKSESLSSELYERQISKTQISVASLNHVYQ